MLLSPLDITAKEVFSSYPASFHLGSLYPLGSHGGFSGANLWRVEGKVGPFCLRAWPAQVSASRLAEVHRLMTLARGQGLSFVPSVNATVGGRTLVQHASRLWELTEWLPGRADYHEHPTRQRLESACAALARLHCAWQSTGSAEGRGTCPAVGRRLEAVRSWQILLSSGWEPRFSADDADPVHPVGRRAWDVLPRWVERVRPSLGSIPAHAWPLQPCQCDPWHDNLLFEGERLTGLVDYGSVKVDHVAVDLARLLGSLAEDDAEGWRVGLEAYRGVRPLGRHEEELAHALDRTGAVVGVVQWLRWLYEVGSAFPDRSKAAARLDVLVRRIERWEENRFV
jgi:homoserine kinase type II